MKIKGKLLFFRKIYFTASHSYNLSGLSAAENLKKFGKVSKNHKHKYVVEVGVAGKFDKKLGMIADLPELNKALKDIHKAFDKKNINETILFFKKTLPTTENLCLYLAQELNLKLKKSRVKIIRVYESDDLWAEYSSTNAAYMKL